MSGMVEKRGAGYWMTHLGLIIGLLFIFFPIWLAFIASTVSQPEIVKPPMPLLPGDQFFENYRKALVAGVIAGSGVRDTAGLCQPAAGASCQHVPQRGGTRGLLG